MTWYAVYQTENGQLVGGTSDSTRVASASVLAARGYSVAALADGPTNPNGATPGVWNVATHMFDPLPPVLTVLTPLQFVQRFAAAEFIAIKASTDANVQFFMEQVNRADTITPQDTTVQNGLNYLASLGLLTSTRAAIIGAN